MNAMENQRLQSSYLVFALVYLPHCVLRSLEQHYVSTWGSVCVLLLFFCSRYICHGSIKHTAGMRLLMKSSSSLFHLCVLFSSTFEFSKFWFSIKVKQWEKEKHEHKFLFSVCSVHTITLTSSHTDCTTIWVSAKVISSPSSLCVSPYSLFSLPYSRHIRFYTHRRTHNLIYVSKTSTWCSFLSLSHSLSLARAHLWRARWAPTSLT